MRKGLVSSGMRIRDGQLKTQNYKLAKESENDDLPLC